MSEDAKLVIEGSRENLEKKARQSLELMDESEAMASDKTAQSDDSRTQDAATPSGKDTDAGNRAANAQPSSDKRAEVEVGGGAQQRAVLVLMERSVWQAWEQLGIGSQRLKMVTMNKRDFNG